MQPRVDQLSGRVDGVGFEAWKEYDDAMHDWLSGVGKFRDGQADLSIPVVMATPEKAFAKAVAPTNEGQANIPMVSFYMTGLQLDVDKRGMAPAHLPAEVWRQVTGDDSWSVRGTSLPVTLTYQATLWAKYYHEVRYFAWAILSRFQPNSQIVANGAVSPIFLESVADQSELEPGTGKDRALRQDWTLRVEGWLPRHHRVVGAVGKISVGLTDDPTMELAEFPDAAGPKGAGVVYATVSMMDATGGPGGFGGPGPGVYTSDANQAPPESASRPSAALYDGPIGPRGVLPLATVTFAGSNDPGWAPTERTPVRAWQPRDEANPAAGNWAEVLLTSKADSPEGVEYRGVGMTGRFRYPYRVTSDGAVYHEARRWSRFLRTRRGD